MEIFKRHKILILHSSSDLYGASKILLVTIEFLKKDGNIIYVVLSEEGPLADKIRALGIEVLILKLGIIRRKYFSIRGIVNRLRVIANAKKQLIKTVRDKQVDLLYSNTTAVLVGMLVAKTTKIKHVWHVHEIITQPGLFVKFIGWCLKNYGDKIVVVSEAVKNHWKQYVDEDKIVTIYNGINYTPFINSTTNLRTELKVDDNIVLVGMIARVHHWKGQEYFLKIATLIAKKHDNVRFVMVGDVFPGNEYIYKRIEIIKRTEGIGHLVTDLGYRTDIPNIHKGLDVFLMPSIGPDPFPTVILESMATGKPVVATAHGGALEMLENNKTGLIIPWDDAVKAASIIEPLIVNVKLRNTIGELGQQCVLKYFSLKRFEQNFIYLINSLNKCE